MELPKHLVCGYLVHKYGLLVTRCLHSKWVPHMELPKHLDAQQAQRLQDAGMYWGCISMYLFNMYIHVFIQFDVLIIASFNVYYINTFLLLVH